MPTFLSMSLTPPLTPPSPLHSTYSIYGQFTMETVLGAAFGSQVNVLKGEGDSLTEAAAGILAEVDIRAILWSNLITCKTRFN